MNCTVGVLPIVSIDRVGAVWWMTLQMLAYDWAFRDKARRKFDIANRG